jgi:hypothetical protein
MSNLHVHAGLLLVTFADGAPAYGHAIPPPLWTRVIAEVTRQGLASGYRAALAAETAKLNALRTSEAWHGELDEHAAEEGLFRRVVEKAYGAQTLWPWQRGWTQEIADAYPVANRAAKEAA